MIKKFIISRIKKLKTLSNINRVNKMGKLASFSIEKKLGQYLILIVLGCICLTIGCKNHPAALRGATNSEAELIAELIATMEELDAKAQAGDVEGVEKMFDPYRIELHKRRMIKAGYAWDKQNIKKISWLKALNDKEIIGVTSKGIWTRLEMKRKIVKDNKHEPLHILIFYKLGDKWKLYNNTEFISNNDLNVSVEEIIKRETYTEAYIPPITEVGVNEYKKVPVNQLIENKKNKDESLKSQYIETEGVLSITDVGKTHFFKLKPSINSDILMYINLTIRDEYIKDLEKIISQCNSQCNAVVRGVVSKEGLIASQIEIR